jgi:RNA polymerase sigma factor (sigma-70 family)
MGPTDDRIRFEQAVLPWLGDAYNLARWLMGNDQDAQDMVQESFVRAFRHFGRSRAETGRSWLLRIVRNTCYTALSARSGAGEELSLDEGFELPDLKTLDPSGSIQQRATVEKVRQAVESLPIVFREAIILRELEGLSYKEISEIAGVPIGTVMSRLARARDLLTEVLFAYRREGYL